MWFFVVGYLQFVMVLKRITKYEKLFLLNVCDFQNVNRALPHM